MYSAQTCGTPRAVGRRDYAPRTNLVAFNNRRFGASQKSPSRLGTNAKAGRFVGMDVADSVIDFRRCRRR
jgi:hypothetical protein